MVLTCITLLMPAFSLLRRSTGPHGPASTLAERSPTTHPPRGRIRSFGVRLEPRYIFGAESLDQ